MTVQKITFKQIANTGGLNGQVLAANSTDVFWKTITSGGGFSNGQSISVTNLIVTGNATISGFETKATANSRLANTNSRIGLLNTNLTGTNTALRTLISDRLQVSNATTLFNNRLTVANSRNYLQVANSKTYLQVANADVTYQTKTVERAALANTNLRINLVNTNLTGTNTALRTLISDRIQVANAAATYETKATADSRLANTNSYIATRASWTALTGTNTALRTLISDRLQVANAAALYATKGYSSSNSYVNATFLKITGPQTTSQTVNTNIEFAANVHIEGKLTVIGGITSYFANNVSTSDNMILLNSNSTLSNPDLGFAGNYNDGVYRHAGFFRDASDNGTFKVFHRYTPEPDANVFINTSHASFELAPFSALNIRTSNNLIVEGNAVIGKFSANGSLGSSGQFLRTNGSTVHWSSLPVQTQYLQVANATILFNNRLTVANSKTYLQVANATTLFNNRLTVANSKTYLQVANATTLFNDRLTVANSRNYLQVANSKTYLQVANSKTYLQVANATTLFNNRLTVANSRTYLQVANADTLYATKVNPTTSGLLAHTGRATISTNLAVTGNTTVSGLIANGTLGTSNYVLKTNGTTVFWGESTGGGGSTTQYLQVANATILFNNRLTVANSRNYLQVANSKTYLQVANAVTLYTTKSNPTTSGLLAHTGRVTVSTNLYVAGNTVFGDPSVVTDRSVINGVLVANGNLSVAGNTTIGAAGKRANATGWFGVTGRATISTNLFVAGNTTIKGLSANGTLGTANFVLKTNGTTTFWGAAASGGGVTLANEVASATTHYPTMSTTSTGSWTAGRVSTTKLYFTPSTGQLNATIFNSLSDKRVKKNIKIVDDALNTVNGMRGVKFNWKETSTPSIGLIAQEVEKLLPELVHTGHNGEKSVNYGGVVGVLVEAIKELSARIDKLEGK